MRERRFLFGVKSRMLWRACYIILFYYFSYSDGFELQRTPFFFFQERGGDESKIHLRKLCIGVRRVYIPLVEPTFAKVPSP